MNGLIIISAFIILLGIGALLIDIRAELEGIRKAIEERNKQIFKDDK